MLDNEIQPLFRSAKLLGHFLLLILVVLVLSAAVIIGFLLLDLQGTGQYLMASVGYDAATPRAWQSYSLGTLILVQIGIWVMVVLSGRSIFTALKAADAKGASVAANKAARFLWFMLVWGILAHMLGTIIATWHFPAGQNALSINFGSSQISTAFAALLATFSSQAFSLGAALWQDHKEVI
jgi:hypothetical protein